MALSKIFCIFIANYETTYRAYDDSTYNKYNLVNHFKTHKAMKAFLWIVIAIAIIFVVLHFMKVFFKFYYGWRIKLQWYIITFTTADKTKTLYALAFSIDDSIYRLRFYDYATEEEVIENINKIYNSANKHKTKKNLIDASHHTPEERISNYTPIESAPVWIYKLCKIKWL